MTKKRKSLKNLFLTRIIAAVVIIIMVISVVSANRLSHQLEDLTSSIIGRESVSYSYEISNWWNLIESRVEQTAAVYKSLPSQEYSDVWNMLLALTKSDPDSQDIYIAYGNDMTFLDGSGWVPDETFVFTGRAWYQGALKQNGSIYVSDPYLDASTGKTCLACAIKLEDNVVLSSDIVFDKLSDKIKGFKYSYSDTAIYIINKDTTDILLSSNNAVVGKTLAACDDPIVKGLAGMYTNLNTSLSFSDDKAQIVKTGAGKMIFAATDIEGTSWVVVSAVPYKHISSLILSSTNVNMAISIALLLLLAGFLYFFIKKHLDPVTVVTGKIGEISSGDFTTKLVPEGNNEITTLSESLNDYIARMRDMLKNLTGISKDMHNSAEQCLDITGGLSSSNTSQGESIERLNDYLNGLNQSIEDVANGATELASVSSMLAQNSVQVKELCQETVQSSNDGRNEMKGMTESVTTLNKTIGELISIIRMTAETVDEIKGITGTISDISSQTNLLSLNASIEAARAGEAGKGFAVVAGEVGALANQSTSAAVQIGSLVETITQNIVEINKKADDCMRDMEKCLAGVERSNESFQSIYKDISRATDAIGEIADGINRINDVASNNAAATEEQAATVNQIIELSDGIVKDSSKISNETGNLSDVSEKLNGYSSSIMDDLKNFKLQ
jgi:methyl-accepting chemotaxis protein